jgi:hypothetical protein
MFSSEIRRMLIQVITSWQVIAATVVVVIYIFIVSHVARIYNRKSRNSNTALIPKDKKKKEKSGASAPPVTDELGLGEETKK